MIRRLLLLGLLLSSSASAFDLDNARKINNKCALCHGLYGQGTPGSMSPRIAGLPTEYLVKELEYYRDGTRKYAPMVLASSIQTMSDKDISDVSEYLSSLELEKMDLPEIPVFEGDFKSGAKLFRQECKTCHGDQAQGKPKKGAPMLAGQYASYILSQIRKFRAKERYHDNDPEDETFADFEQEEIDSIAAYLTSLTKTLKDERIQLAKAEAAKSGKADMSGMSGMAGMSGMSGMAEKALTCSEEECNVQTADDGYAGTFKVTSRGDVILSPAQRDLRLVSGLQGRFRVSPKGGLEFIPDSTNSDEGKENKN